MLRATAIAAILAATAAKAPSPSAQDRYNEGVHKMQSDNLVEAETAFIDAARTNHPVVQPLAVYNLGHVRFLQGKETLAGEGNRQQLLDNANAAFVIAGEALRSGKAALLDEKDLRGLVAAYNEAREARKGLRASRDETSRATALLGSALAQWRKSADGFWSAFELDPSNKDAEFNAGVMQKRIEELIRFDKQLQQQSEGIGQQRKELSEMMKEMRGKIPKDMQRESDQEEDEDDEEEDSEGQGGGQKKKEKEKPAGEQQQQRLGSGRQIDPDMLQMLKEKIDRSHRTMSLDGEQPGKPQGRPGRDW